MVIGTTVVATQFVARVAQITRVSKAVKQIAPSLGDNGKALMHNATTLVLKIVSVT
jgi:hypothetical protein